MSKGWESKNVEEQQAEADRTPVSPSAAQLHREDGDRKRRIQALELQREQVLNERTSNPHRRSALESALVTIEMELEQLGWSIKL